MWITLRILRLARVKTFTPFVAATVLVMLSGYSTVAESTSTCWVHRGIMQGQNTQMIYGLNELEGQSWPDPVSVFGAFKQLMENRLLNLGCMLPYYSFTTITQVDAGFKYVSLTTLGPIGDPRTGIPVGYSQIFTALNQAGEYCSVSAIYDVIDGSYWGYPQCQENYIVKLSPYSGTPESGAILASVEPSKGHKKFNGKGLW